jgi:hypothetical protein
MSTTIKRTGDSRLRSATIERTVELFWSLAGLALGIALIVKGLLGS